MITSDVVEQDAASPQREPTLEEIGRWFWQTWDASLSVKVREVRVARLDIPGVVAWRVDYCAYVSPNYTYDHIVVIYLHNGALHLAPFGQGALIDRSTDL